MTLIGVGYRRALAGWIETQPPELDCLEITAEHFFDGGEVRLRELAERYPLMVHGLGLSLGTPGPLDADVLSRFARVVKTANPLWISEHVAFTRCGNVDLGHLNPLSPCAENISMFADHAAEVIERCGKPLILENITSDLRLSGTLSEPEFLNRLCEAANCKLLLDVTNLFINGQNHDFDPRAWLYEIDPSRIVQLHVVGYSRDGERWCDRHAEAIQEDLWGLIDEAREYAHPEAIIVERDANFPLTQEIADEIRRLRNGYVHA